MKLNNLVMLTLGIAAGSMATYWYAHRPLPVSTPAAAEQSPSAGERQILYYRNPMGARHLPSAQKGCDGNGLHPRLCG